MTMLIQAAQEYGRRKMPWIRMMTSNGKEDQAERWVRSELKQIASRYGALDVEFSRHEAEIVYPFQCHEFPVQKIMQIHQGAESLGGSVRLYSDTDYAFTKEGGSFPGGAYERDIVETLTVRVPTGRTTGLFRRAKEFAEVYAYFTQSAVYDRQDSSKIVSEKPVTEARVSVQLKDMRFENMRKAVDLMAALFRAD